MQPDEDVDEPQQEATIRRLEATLLLEEVEHGGVSSPARPSPLRDAWCEKWRALEERHHSERSNACGGASSTSSPLRDDTTPSSFLLPLSPIALLREEAQPWDTLRVQIDELTDRHSVLKHSYLTRNAMLSSFRAWSVPLLQMVQQESIARDTFQGKEYPEEVVWLTAFFQTTIVAHRTALERDRAHRRGLLRTCVHQSDASLSLLHHEETIRRNAIVHMLAVAVAQARLPGLAQLLGSGCMDDAMLSVMQAEVEVTKLKYALLM